MLKFTYSCVCSFSAYPSVMERTKMDDANKMKLNTKHLLNFNFKLFIYWPRFKIHLLLTNSLESLNKNSINLKDCNWKLLLLKEKCRSKYRTRNVGEMRLTWSSTVNS